MQNDLPIGIQAQVVTFGQNQLHAIDNCLEIKPQPAPSELLVDGDILIAVRAAEIVWTDTVMATGQYQHQPVLPYSPGMTYAGIVVQTTEKARNAGIKEGQRVAIAGESGPRSLGKYQRWGGCSSYAIAPATAVRYFPPSWSFAEAACFAYGYDTAYHCLITVGQIKAGETILIHGATGGVGIPAVRLAVMLGLTVLATTRSREKEEFLKSLGVHQVIVLEDGKGFSGEVKQLTAKKGVDVVYDGVGGDDITVESMKALAFGGRLLIVGWAATPNVAKGSGQRGSENANRIPTNLIMMKSLRVLGCPAMISLKHDKTLLSKRVNALSKWFEEGKLAPLPIGSTFPLEDIKEALKSRVKSGSTLGSTIVIPPELDFKRKAKL